MSNQGNTVPVLRPAVLPLSACCKVPMQRVGSATVCTNQHNHGKPLATVHPIG